MRLRRKGYGVSKGIPTLVLAVSGIDDAASVAVFGILISVIFPSNSLTMTIVSVCYIISFVVFYSAFSKCLIFVDTCDCHYI